MRSLGFGLGFNRHKILGGVVPLLDTYTGASAAYSLRNLSSSTTNVVRVRRSSNDDEQDFTASEVSGGALATFVGAGNDGFVTTWYDQVPIEELSSAYGTSITGTVFGSTDQFTDVAPVSSGNFYRIQWTVSAIQTRGRVRFRNASNGSNINVLAGQGNLSYFTENGVYTTFVASDAGVSLNFLGDSGQGFTYSNVSVVEIDRIPNDAIQTSASAQPKIVDSGSVVQENGKPTIDFDGTNDFLEIESSNSSFNFLHNGTSCSLYAVTKRIQTTSTISLLGNNAGAGSKIGYGMFYYANDSLLSYITRGATGAAVENLSASGQDIEVQHLIFDNIDADNSTASNRSILNISGGVDIKNNTLTNSPSTSNATHNMQIGASGSDGNNWYGNIQEFVIFNVSKSSNQSAIENNITSHYSI